MIIAFDNRNDILACNFYRFQCNPFQQYFINQLKKLIKNP